MEQWGALKHPRSKSPHGIIKVRRIPPTGAQLHRSTARPHLTGDEELPAQAAPPRTGRERLQTWLLRGRPAGEENTQVGVRATLMQNFHQFSRICMSVVMSAFQKCRGVNCCPLQNKVAFVRD